MKSSDLPESGTFPGRECMYIAGVDEVGRGPLAGPVVTAAVILTAPIEGITDSKLLKILGPCAIHRRSYAPVAALVSA